MDNVYRQVALFYQENDDLEDVLSRDVVEKYLRKCAWGGDADEKLRDIWDSIAIILLYIKKMQLYSLASLNVHDYQEALYMQQDEGRELSECLVLGFFAALETFYQYLQKFVDEDLTLCLAEAKKSFYPEGAFLLPERQGHDAFFNTLEHLDELTPEDAEQLNELLETLLNKAGEYFRRPPFLFDLTRAVSIYAGPFMEVEKENEDEFWFSFWDYFFFDYHLIQSDATPLRYYYEHEKERLQPSERYILQDLLKAHFMVFSIEGINDEYIQCTDIFTHEVINLPAPDYGFMDFKKVILYGHLHVQGVMMLNYITSVPATSKLRQRMKEEVLRQYELYKEQEPEATLPDFFKRHAAAVRHTINILANFAQLKVVSTKHHTRPVFTVQHTVEASDPTRAMLAAKAKKAGFSIHAVHLVQKMLDDFRTAQGTDVSWDIKNLVAAFLLLFADLNGLDFVQRDFVMELTGALPSETQDLVQEIRTTLDCAQMDPRYLTEEGFVRALYVI